MIQNFFSLSNWKDRFLLRYRKDGLMEGGRIKRSAHFVHEFKKSTRHQEKMSRKPLEMSVEFGGEVGLRV